MDGGTRPFYGEYAWAYDLIISQPVARQCEFIAGALARLGVRAASRILDAGCGVGNHAIELARRGYSVTGIDSSPQLLMEAQRRAALVHLPITFTRGDILELPATREAYEGILSHGVLNDFLCDSSRRRVFQSFATALRPSGALILDVRDWAATARRKTKEPIFEKTVETARGPLTFRSVARLDDVRRRLIVEERHTLIEGGVERHSVYNFTMRCWTREELDEDLTSAGFEAVEYFGGYAQGVAPGASDRMVCVAVKL